MAQLQRRGIGGRAHTRLATRAVLRQGAYVLTGSTVMARRTWDARTTARHQRMMRAAEALGDHAVAKEWEERAEAHRAARHQRRMTLLTDPIIAARALACTAAGLFALGILIAISSRHPADVIRPLMDTGSPGTAPTAWRSPWPTTWPTTPCWVTGRTGAGTVPPSCCPAQGHLHRQGPLR